MAKRVKISEIRIETRYRYDMGDIAGLAASMADIGQLQPVVITEDCLLVAGERRLAAARSLGWEDVQVYIITNFADAAELLRAERDENTCRKEMTMSELVAIGKRLEELERPKARERQGERTDLTSASGDAKVSGDGYTRTSEVVGDALGMSARQYERASAVVDATSDPDPAVAEVAREAAREMDETGRVRPAKGRPMTRGLTGEGPIADAIYDALSGSFGDFGADHAKKAADAVVEALTSTEGRNRAAKELRRHLTDQSYETGCRLACGYDGSDLDYHLAANVVRAVAEQS